MALVLAEHALVRPGPGPDPAEWALVGVGAGFAALGAGLPRLPSRLAGPALALVAVFFALVVAEGIGRVVGYDFHRSAEAWEATPVYYRKPTVPVGEVFFRRPAFVRWDGRVLGPWLERKRIVEVDAYPDEAPISVRHDAQGFRNPPELRDWEIVFVGDSFTELGYLPDGELFTSRVAQALGVAVRNLGVSFTGTLTHTFYLEAYGKSEATTDAVLVFFEGNDLRDIRRENEDLENWRRSGVRPLRDLESARQTSFLIATSGLFWRAVKGRRRAVNATLRLGDREVPVTVTHTPPARATIVPETRRRLRDALRGWGRTARSLGLRPWLVYLPCKRRVWHGRLRFHDNARSGLVDWQPTDMPALVRELSQRSGIRFIDPTASLVAETARGQLAYNHVLDTHLDRRGSEIVAEVIARALRSRPGSPPREEPEVAPRAPAGNRMGVRTHPRDGR